MSITAKITKTPSNVCVGKATDATGEPVVLCSVENIVVINGVACNPKSSPLDSMKGGDAITAEVTKSARLEGVSKIWIVVSDQYDGPDARTIRVVEEEIPQALTTQRLGCVNPVPPVSYLN